MTMKIAIIGTGGVAEKNYLPYIVEREDIQLSYLNRTRSKAEAVAERFGGRVAADAADLMADEPDACLVFTRETDRLDAAHALLPFKPRRLFFEKPARSSARPNQCCGGGFLVQAARRTARPMLWRRRRSGGRCISAAWCITPAGAIASTWRSTSWGRPPAQRAGHGGVAPVWARRIRATTVAARMANDATGTLIGTCGIDFKLPLYELTFAYENGRISMRDLDGEMEVIDYRTGRHERHNLRWDISRWDQYRASFGKAINGYLDSVRDGDPPPVPGLAGLQELQFEAGIKRAIASGATVALEEEFGLGGVETSAGNEKLRIKSGI